MVELKVVGRREKIGVEINLKSLKEEERENNGEGLIKMPKSQTGMIYYRLNQLIVI